MTENCNFFNSRQSLSILSCQQCHCGVFRSGGLGLEPPGVPLVDQSGQDLLIVAEATTLGVPHQEGEGEADQEEGGQSHVLIMVQ